MSVNNIDNQSLLAFDSELDDYEATDGTKKEGKATIASSVFNLTNTILGSGTLAVAYTCQQSGWVVFLVIMISMACLSHYAVMLIFKTVEIVNFPAGSTITYGLLGKRLYGRVGELVAEWAVTLQQLGACIGYVVIIGDVLSPITGLAGGVFQGEWLIQLLVVMLVIFPICLLRNMDALKFTSLIAICCILATALTLAIYGFDVDLHSTVNASAEGGPSDPNSCGKVRSAPRDLTVLSSFPVFSFAFLCHQNTFPIYEELKDASVKRMGIISAMSMTLAILTYLLAGVGGYLAFADGTLDDILLNFNVTPGSTTGTAHSGLDTGCVASGVMSYIIDVVRVGFGLALIFSYPVVVFEARRNLGFLCCSRRLDKLTGLLSTMDNFFLNLAIVGGTAAVGIGIPFVTTTALDFVIDFVGSTCSPTMVFILPALFFLKATHGKKPLDKYGCDRTVAYLLLIFGCLLVPVCLVLWLLGIVCSAQAVPSEFCYTLGLVQNVTTTTNVTLY